MASTVKKLLPVCVWCQMFVGICSSGNRGFGCAFHVHNNAQNTLGNGGLTFRSQSSMSGRVAHGQTVLRALLLLLCCKGQISLPSCGQGGFALWCAHAETFRHRCGARSSKPVAGLAVCGRFDPYTSPPIKSLFCPAVRGRRFLPRFCRGFSVSAPGARGASLLQLAPVQSYFSDFFLWLERRCSRMGACVMPNILRRARSR